MSNFGFCSGCTFWQFEENPAMRSPDEQDGFGVCDRIEQMKSNPIRAVAKLDDDLTRFLTREEFGCALFEAR